MTFKLNSYETDQGLMVAVADPELLGETFEEDGVRIDVDREFYDGREAEREEVSSKLNGASIANLVGEEAVNLGIEIGTVDPENVLDVEGVPHAQMVRI
ncbi:MAG: DUF424 domain-containing protein [Halobacteria archaeon]